MHTDVSCFLKLKKPVKHQMIGDSIRLEEVLKADWWKEVKQKDKRVAAKVELAGGYTHRFVVTLGGIRFSPNGEALEDAKQQIIRTIVLSRIVRPTSIASGGLWISTEYLDSGESEHFPSTNDGEFGRAYLLRETDESTLTDKDLNTIADLWPAMERLFQDVPRYQRVVRALKFFDAGFHLWYGEFRHLIFHAALESMICTKRHGNRQQVVKRLTALVPSITEPQAIEIYERCCDIKHAAASFPYAPPSNAFASDRTYEPLNRLEIALRELLMRVLCEEDFAKLIADPAALDKAHPI